MCLDSSVSSFQKRGAGEQEEWPPTFLSSSRPRLFLVETAASLVVLAGNRGTPMSLSSWLRWILSFALLGPFFGILSPMELFLSVGALCFFLGRTNYMAITIAVFLTRNRLLSWRNKGVAALAALGKEWGVVKDLCFGMCIRNALVSLGILLLTVLVERILWAAKYSPNLKRKVFHLAAFLYFSLLPVKLLEAHSLLLLSFFLVAPEALEWVRKQVILKKTRTNCSARRNSIFGREAKTTSLLGKALLKAALKEMEKRAHEKIIFKEFLSEKDEKAVVSHLLLLCGCLFMTPLSVVSRRRYLSSLSSLGILDTVSSMFPVRDKRGKSFSGSLLGALFSFLVGRVFWGGMPLLFCVLIGVCEYFSECNDNITLPILSYGLSSVLDREMA
jgi:dolichol kinase